MLDLEVDPGLAPALREALIQEARRSGAPLEAVELMSYDAHVVERFLVAARAGAGMAFVDTVDRARLGRRRRRALETSWGVVPPVRVRGVTPDPS